MISKKAKAVSLALKCVVILSALIGTCLSYYAGGQDFMGGRRVFMYFTIQSNLASALVCAVGAVLLWKRERIGLSWYVVKYVMTVSITLTGAVYCFVLAPTLGTAAWRAQHVLTHVVVPLASIADFFVTGIYARIRNRCVFLVTLPPLAYAIYAGIGYVRGWQFARGINYPYFFLNWGSPAGAFGFTDRLPYMGCVWWILALLIVLLFVGYLYLAILAALQKRRKQPDV